MSRSDSASDQNGLENIPQELVALGKCIDSMPAPYKVEVGEVFDRVLQATSRRKQVMKQIQESLSQLRLDVKYLMFDLQTTRRERDELMVELEEARKDR